MANPLEGSTVIFAAPNQTWDFQPVHKTLRLQSLSALTYTLTRFSDLNQACQLYDIIIYLFHRIYKVI